MVRMLGGKWSRAAECEEKPFLEYSIILLLFLGLNKETNKANQLQISGFEQQDNNYIAQKKHEMIARYMVM